MKKKLLAILMRVPQQANRILEFAFYAMLILAVLGFFLLFANCLDFIQL